MASNSFQNEVPKARVNIRLELHTGGAQKKVELPLKLMLLGDYSNGREQRTLSERSKVDINKNNFNQVLAEFRPELKLAVANTLADDGTDASVELMLGRMIRADSGRIEQFLHQQLQGVLRKQGNRWVVDPAQSQGLRFNPQFLAAINQLAELADALYTDDGMATRFELQAKPVRDLVQTTFTLDGEKHHYFNQREFWQRFTWPGRTDYPGTRLTWTRVHTGERLFGDFAGPWGLIRLLEQASATPLDDSHSRYRLTLGTPDGLDLTWHMRTEVGAGPLALLKLRGFTLPRQIFLTANQPGMPVAYNEETP
jgi:type VI secretion system protein ImpL